MNDTLRGQLAEGSLPNLLQYLALSQATGCLLLRHPQGSQGQLYFEGGKPVHIRYGSQEDTLALASLLGWKEGQFIFRSGVNAPLHSVKSTLDSLLLEAAYQADTMSRGRGGLFDESTVLVPKPLTEGDQKVAMTLRSLQLLRHLDGVRSLGELILRSGLTRTDLFLAAEELYQQGLVQPLGAKAVPASFVDDLTRVVVDLMGPMGEIVIEDALYDLGLSPAALPVNRIDGLLREVKRQFRRSDWQISFEQQARALRARYGLGVSGD